MPHSPSEPNPLLEPWSGPFEAPPFDRIEPRHFRPAFEAALKEARREIDAVADDPEPPTFANTIEALERSGRALDRVARVFFNLAGDGRQRRTRGDRARDRAGSRAPPQRHLPQRGAVPAHRRAAGGRSRARADARAGARARPLSSRFLPRGRGLAPEAKARLAAIGERLATLVGRVRPERARRREGLDAAARGRAISTACPISSSRAPRASPPSAAHPGATR